MALHTDLEIHKVAEELLGLSLDLVRNIPRDLKHVVGAKIRDECLQVLVLIGRGQHDPGQTASDQPAAGKHLDAQLPAARPHQSRVDQQRAARQGNDDDGLSWPPGKRLEEVRNRARCLRVKALLPVRKIWSSR